MFERIAVFSINARETSWFAPFMILIIVIPDSSFRRNLFRKSHNPTDSHPALVIGVIARCRGKCSTLAFIHLALEMCVCGCIDRTSLSNMKWSADEKNINKTMCARAIASLNSHRMCLCTIILNTLSWSFSLAREAVVVVVDAVANEPKRPQSDAFDVAFHIHSYIHFSGQCITISWQWSLSEEFIECSSVRLRPFGHRQVFACFSYRECVCNVIYIYSWLIHGQTAS